MLDSRSVLSTRVDAMETSNEIKLNFLPIESGFERFRVYRKRRLESLKVNGGPRTIINWNTSFAGDGWTSDTLATCGETRKRINQQASISTIDEGANVGYHRNGHGGALVNKFYKTVEQLTACKSHQRHARTDAQG